MPTPTLLWYDYETTGTDRVRDRPVQFAAIRTDMDLRVVGESATFYCAPAADLLPQPEACLVTGIAPQDAARKGIVEAEFAVAVHELLAEPGTCSAGYNSIRFDDEVNRNLFYRNFLDPYAHTWKNGTARWDIMDLTRACCASGNRACTRGTSACATNRRQVRSWPRRCPPCSRCCMFPAATQPSAAAWPW
jgi:exodeoxyribonuclease-1